MASILAQVMQVALIVGVILTVVGDVLIVAWVSWVVEGPKTFMGIPGLQGLKTQHVTQLAPRFIRAYVQGRVAIILFAVTIAYGLFIGVPTLAAANVDPLAVTYALVLLYFVIWGVALGLLVSPMRLSYRLVQEVVEGRDQERQELEEHN